MRFSYDYDSADDNGSAECHIADDSPMSPKDTVSNTFTVSRDGR